MIAQLIHLKKGIIVMTAKLLVFILFVFSSNAHAFYEAYEIDVKESKKNPLISGRERAEILNDGKAAITVCTTTIKGLFDIEYDHVYLVFEIKHVREPNTIELFSVHYGGDGHSLHIKEGRPIFDNRSETLIKVLGGKRVDYVNSTDINNLQYEYIKPIYRRENVFPVEEKKARDALKNIQNDTDLQYSLSGYPLYGENSYNCVTYADKILKDCGIDTDFDSYYVKNADNFLICCHNFQKTLKLDVLETNANLLDFAEERTRIDDCVYSKRGEDTNPMSAITFSQHNRWSSQSFFFGMGFVMPSYSWMQLPWFK